MSVWLTIPSARPEELINPRLDRWQQNGYRVALWRDSHPDELICDAVIVGPYPGYAAAVNRLIRHVAMKDPHATWFIAAGDDVEPDPVRDASEISHQCFEHFGNTTFGVMQPTGDRWGDRQGAYIDRVAGSAWIGREFATRSYLGLGPLWPAYTHMGVDEELQAVAMKLGVFWQRPDLTQYHDHWGRPRDGETMGERSRMPAFLETANSREEWDRYKMIFERRQKAGFPGSELIG